MKSIGWPFSGRLLVVVGIIACSGLAGAELIQPSRTLEGGSTESGRISVFSEPPGLAVRINGKAVGETPIVGFEIGAGGHLVNVQDNTTEVHVSAGQRVRLSFFRGQFLAQPEMEMVSSGSASPPPSPSAAPPQAPSQPARSGRANDPTYWPFNPRGPIH